MELIGSENFFWPGHLFSWAPPNSGISVSNDMVMVLSPKLYKEFALPYLNRIAKEFGGLFLHSCGDYSHNLENVLSIYNLRAIDIHSYPEVNFRRVCEIVGRKAILHITPGLNWKREIRDYELLWKLTARDVAEYNVKAMLVDEVSSVDEGKDKLKQIRGILEKVGS
ncbi:MAG: hypothetical protein J7L11_01255 [Thermoprotei archaeon]|nr:hypothetical protein [Thermoprotei archaeon]